MATELETRLLYAHARKQPLKAPPQAWPWALSSHPRRKEKAVYIPMRRLDKLLEVAECSDRDSGFGSNRSSSKSGDLDLKSQGTSQAPEEPYTKTRVLWDDELDAYAYADGATKISLGAEADTDRPPDHKCVQCSHAKSPPSTEERSLYWCSYDVLWRYRRVIAAILAMLVFTIIVWLATLKRGANSPHEAFREETTQTVAITFATANVNERTTEQVPRLVSRDIVLVIKVSELEKLARIGRWINSLVVQGDEDQHEGTHDFQIAVPENPRITTLEIQGWISFPAFQALLRATPRLGYLTVDLKLNCQNGWDSELSTYPQLESLTLSGANQGCPLLLFFLRLEHRQLKELRIQNSVFNTESCRALEGFLQHASQSLREVVIKGSGMGDCDFRDIHFPNLRNIIVLEPDA